MSFPVRRGGRQLARWDPFREFEDLYDRMGRLLEGSFGELGRAAQAPWAPPADLEETDDAYVVEAEVPGVAREDITVDLTGRELVIHGEAKQPERSGVVRQQSRRTGRFDYRLMLPGDADAARVDASLSQGVLTIRAPKAEQTKGRRIEVTGE